MIWIQENLLALYAAVVGTIALFLNFGRFWIMYQKGNRKLKVESSIDKSAQKNLDELMEKKNSYRSQGALHGPIYQVTVINSSHVDMHIHDVGLIIKTKDGKDRIKVYVSTGSYGFMSHLDDCGGEDIPAGG